MEINGSFKRCVVFLLEGKQSLEESSAATKDDKYMKLLSSSLVAVEQTLKNKTNRERLLRCSDRERMALRNIQEGI